MTRHKYGRTAALRGAELHLQLEQHLAAIDDHKLVWNDQAGTWDWTVRQTTVTKKGRRKTVWAVERTFPTLSDFARWRGLT